MKNSFVLVTAAVFYLSTLGFAFAGDPTVDALDRFSTWSGYSHLSKGEPSEVSMKTQTAAGEMSSTPVVVITAQANSIDSKAKISLPEPD